MLINLFSFEEKPLFVLKKCFEQFSCYLSNSMHGERRLVSEFKFCNSEF